MSATTEAQLAARVRRLEDMQVRLGSSMFGGVSDMAPTASRKAYQRAVREIEAERDAERDRAPWEMSA